jgi:hypothetical protein
MSDGSSKGKMDPSLDFSVGKPPDGEDGRGLHSSTLRLNVTHMLCIALGGVSLSVTKRPG